MSATKCKGIVDFMENIAPVYLAEDWDNVGLIIGDYERDINHILVSLDVTTQILDYAIEKSVDMIISHHPLIFKPIKRIVYDDWKSVLISRIIKNDICLYCAHTNLDYAKNGVNWNLALALDLNDIKNYGETKSEGEGYSLAKVGLLKPPMKLSMFVSNIKHILGIDSVKLISNNADKAFERDVNKVVVFSGSFDDSVLRYIGDDIDVIITGDVKYHTAVEIAEKGVCVIDAGHFATENVIVPQLCSQLKDRFPDLSVTSKMVVNQPIKFY
ncbi:MAG TPA: Nif3-like dinuclear metal center hexameric protein [Clostridiales bacterium]|nr:Nif3-like dinuclear metal center hexameric protein [Clostridiales bacterium]